MKSDLQKVRRFNVGDALLRTTRRYPDKEALAYCYQGKIIERFTYAQLNKKVNRCAHALIEHGIKKGDRIGIYSHNTSQFLILLYACAKTGIQLAPVNFTLRGTEITSIVNFAEPVMFFTEDDLLDRIVGLEKEMPSVKSWGMINVTKEKPLPKEWFDFEELCSEKYSEEEPDVEIDDDDIVVLLFTSGTEALPKGAPNTHAGWYSSALNAVVDHNWRPEDTMLVSIPLYHLGAQYVTNGIWTIGGKIVLEHLPDPKEMLELFEDEKITAFFGVPALAFNILQLDIPDHKKRKSLSFLEKGVLFGNILPERLVKQLMFLTPRCRWTLGYYGQTETSALGTNLQYEHVLRKYHDSIEKYGGVEPIGQPHLQIEMKIFDDNDNEVPPGTPGEIVMRSPSIFPGYYKLEEKTKEAFKNGWWHTGDIGMMDEEGFFYFVDRKKDAIKTGGENVSSIEVEAAIFVNPKVADCAVTGIEHPRWGEAVTAFVVPKTGEALTEEEVIETCRQNLAGYKVPKKVVFVEIVPKNPSGKTLKRELRNEFKNVYVKE